MSAHFCKGSQAVEAGRLDRVGPCSLFLVGQVLDAGQDRGARVIDLDALFRDIGRATGVGCVSGTAGQFRERFTGDLFDGRLVFSGNAVPDVLVHHQEPGGVVDAARNLHGVFDIIRQFERLDGFHREGDTVDDAARKLLVIPRPGP